MSEQLIAELLDELKAYPLLPSNYHKKLKCGSAHSFGLANRRGLPPQLSALSTERAKLYKVLVELAGALNITDYTSVTIHHNYTLIRRKEKAGGKATLLILGTYKDSGIKLLGKEEIIETQKPVEVDTTKEVVLSSPVTGGDRYVVLYHKIGAKAYTPEFEVHNNSVRLCGERPALSCGSLSFWLEEREAIISFD